MERQLRRVVGGRRPRGARLDRLEEFNAPRYRFVAPLEQFRFILVQPGANRKHADVFLVNGPAVMKAPALDYPLVEAQVGQTLATMADLAPTTPESDALSADLRRRGFRFVGPTIVYAFMESVGLVDDHLPGCWRYRR